MLIVALRPIFLAFLAITLAVDVFLVFFSTIFLSGCFRNYEAYEYKSKENKFVWGVVGAKLIGDKKLIENTMTITSPYELFIWFSSDSVLEGSVEILEIKLVYSDSKRIVFEQMATTEQKFEKYNTDYTAYFSFSNIELEYRDVIVSITFLLKQNQKSIKYTTEISFEKDFKKFKRIIGV